MNDLLLNAIVVENSKIGRDVRLSGLQVDADEGSAFDELLLHLHNRVLGIEARVLGKHLGNDEQSVSVGLHSQPGASFHLIFVR